MILINFNYNMMKMKKIKNRMKYVISAVLIFALFVLSKLEAQTIYNLNEVLSNSVVYENIDVTELKSLYLEIHPSYYFDNDYATDDSPALVAYVGTDNINKLYNGDAYFQSVRLLVIENKNPDSSFTVDLSNMENFAVLEYIVIKSSWDCEPESLINAIQMNPNNNVKVFYLNQIPI